MQTDIAGFVVLIEILTNFADQGVVLPLTVAVTAIFVFTGWYRTALVWACVVCAAFLVIGIGKILTAASLLPWPQHWDMRSPSGHTASGALVYGALLGLFAPWRHRHATAFISASVLAAAFGASRVALGVHTLSDVIAGAVVGVCGAFAMVHFAGPRPAGTDCSRRMAIVVPVCVLVFHGFHVDAEPWVGSLAEMLLSALSKP